MPNPASARRWPTLDAVAADVRVCTLCRLSEGRTKAVPGEGSPSAAILFIGEGPGFNEDQQGRPFVGRAGKLLDDLLAKVPLKREDVFITNVVKCRPPENRDPLPDEAAACRPYLDAQLELINPRVIVTLGRHSMMRFHPEGKISRDHGRILRWENRVLFPLYHPAAALRSPDVMKTLAADIQRLPEAVLAALKPSESPSRAPQPTRPAAPPLVAPESRPRDDSGDQKQLDLF